MPNTRKARGRAPSIPGSAITIITGGAAGAAMGYVLQRAQLCFHSTFAGLLTGRFLPARSWLLAVAVGATGLSVLSLTPGPTA